MKNKFGLLLIELGIKVLAGNSHNRRIVEESIRRLDVLKEINSLDEALGRWSESGDLHKFARLGYYESLIDYIGNNYREESSDGWMLLKLLSEDEHIEVVREEDKWVSTEIPDLKVHCRNENIIKKGGEYYYRGCRAVDETGELKTQKIKLPFVDLMEYVELPESITVN